MLSTALKLGGGDIARTHFANQTFEELKESFAYDLGDEFVDIYNSIKIKLPAFSTSVPTNIPELAQAALAETDTIAESERESQD